MLSKITTNWKSLNFILKTQLSLYRIISMSWALIILNTECRVKLSCRKKVLIKKTEQSRTRRSQTKEYFVNFKNVINVSAADSVACGVSIYTRLRAKLGEREVKADASVRLNSRWGKKVPISSQNSSSGCDATAHVTIPHPASEWNIERHR